jgi:hypothetical protein
MSIFQEQPSTVTSEPPAKKKKRKDKASKEDTALASEEFPQLAKDIPVADMESIRKEVATMIKESGVSAPEDIAEPKKKKDKKKKDKEYGRLEVEAAGEKLVSQTEGKVESVSEDKKKKRKSERI